MLPTVRRRLQASLPLLNQSTPPPPRLDSLLLTIPPELDFSHLMKKASPGPENGYRPRGRNVMDGKALGDEGKKWIGKMKARPPGIGGEKKQMSGGEGEGRPRQDRREGQAQGQGPTQPRFQRQPRDQNQSFDRHPRNASFNNSNNRSNNQSRPQFQTKSASSSPTDAFSPASENANDARTPAPPKPRTYNQQRWKEDIDAARADGSQQPHKRSGMYQARGEQRGNRSENRDGSGSTGPEGKNNFSRDRTNNATSGKASRPLNRRNDRRQSSDTPAPVSVSSETDISRSLDKARMEPISEEELFGLGSSRSGGAGMTGKKEDFAVVESGRGEGVMKAKGAGESRAARTGELVSFHGPRTKC